MSLAQSAQLEQYAFHGTSKANLRAIRAVGLVPKVGDNTAEDEGRDVEAKVCLALDKSTARKYAKKADDGGVVLQVNLEEPEVAAAVPQKDAFTRRAVTVNQRIPPDVLKVVKETLQRVESASLRRMRLAEASAGNPAPRADFGPGEYQPSAERMATEYGFLEAFRSDHGDLGTVVRYFHPRGDNLIITRRKDLTRPVNQHAGFQDRLKGVSGNWDTRWEYHTVDGTRSTGYDTYGLRDHLQRIHRG